LSFRQEILEIIIFTRNQGVNNEILRGLKSAYPPFPADFAVLVSIPVEGGTISSYMNLETGFLLSGVPAGTYTVTLDPG
jgi:hypothetical protein